MWKKVIIISLCISVLFVFSAPISTVNAGGRNIQFKWQIAGTIVDSIPLHIPLPFVYPFVGYHSLLNLSAQGPPSAANLTIISKFDGLDSSYECDEEQTYPYPLYFDKNDGIALANNGSFLYVSINDTDRGIFCQGPNGGYFKVKVDIDYGTGIFAGADGELEAVGYTHPATSDGTISSLIGTITRPIIVPSD